MSPGCRLGYLSWAASNPGSTAHGPRATAARGGGYRTVQYVPSRKRNGHHCGLRRDVVQSRNIETGMGALIRMCDYHAK